MNKFEKRALAKQILVKRAYMALIKRAELPSIYTTYLQREPYKPGSVTPQPIPTWSGPTPVKPIQGQRQAQQPQKPNWFDTIKGFFGYGGGKAKQTPPITNPVYRKDVTPMPIPTDRSGDLYRYPDGTPMPKYHYPQNGELFDLN